jgi:hypothetical protein
MARSKISLAAAVVAGIIALPSLVVLQASAQSPDAEFLGHVRSMGNPGLATRTEAAPNVVVEAGRSVCEMLDDGYGFNAVTGMVLDRLAVYGERRDYDAGLLGVYAVAAYCPAHQADSGFNDNY